MQAHSPDSSDLLPGLYVLSQAWLQEAVVGGFRPDAFEGQAAADLGQWFAARRVQLYIQASEAAHRRFSDSWPEPADKLATQLWELPFGIQKLQARNTDPAESCPALRSFLTHAVRFALALSC